jgi:lycopene beta-cyclase
MSVKPYDFIFVGGGLAGLSLAYHLAHSRLPGRSMLVIDRDVKNRNDRTWCFWTHQPMRFDDIVHRQWSQIHFAGDKFERDLDLGDYRYKLIRGLDFYQFVRQDISAHANVKFLRGTVEEIDDDTDCSRVLVDGRTYTGRWVFDSRFSLKAFQPGPAHLHYVQQHFKGWEIETSDDAFNPETATLLDFRTPQKHAMRFFYVLPFSQRRALVEYVTLGPDRYDEALRVYMENVLRIQDYRVLASEGGISPMTDHVFPRRAGKHIMNIGVRGGRIKPSTGYAFLRIQQDCSAIAQSLLARGHPFAVPSDSGRYRLYDSLMLEVMQRHGDEIKPIFTALFKNNPIERVLRFLDEEASPAENSLLIASLPPRLFLQALFQLKRRI